MGNYKVLVFIITDFARSDGAVLWAANMLECFSRVPGMNFSIVSIGPEEVRKANETFVRTLGLNHLFVPFLSPPTPGRDTRWSRLSTTADRLLTVLSEKYFFLLERDARRQKHVDVAAMDIVRETRPDLIIVNGRNAALHVRSVFSLNIRCCFITLDNEIAYQKMNRSQAGPLGEKLTHRVERWISRSGNWVADSRFRSWIDWLYRHCAGVVALSRNDLPPDLPNHVIRAVIPPILKKKDLQWRYRATRCLLFVGTITVLKYVHVANRLAIEWICTQLAPELSRIDARVKVIIIGARSDQVPSSWQQSNITFLGRADKESVAQQMSSADLFIAPIANNLGAKLKLAECVSYGTPFLATEAAMSGLPFLTSIPRIDLDHPRAAAGLVLEHMDNPEELLKLCQSITTQAQQARAEQDTAWITFLRNSVTADDSSMRPTGSMDNCEAT